MNRTSEPCPLCGAFDSNYFHNDRNRDYYRCKHCFLIHVSPAQYLSPEEERAEYDKHQNSPSDPGYRSFLGRLFTPLNARVKSASLGLDFGCGPGPTLSLMFEEAGHRVNLYDPFYAKNEDVLTMQYDFVTASEVIEHLHAPAKELNLLWSTLKPGGWLGIMTKLALGEDAFAKWHYKNDLTHVCFFSEETMGWLARNWETTYERIGKDVILFPKHP